MSMAWSLEALPSVVRQTDVLFGRKVELEIMFYV
jgi:hypothetical protein